uniref:Large ribosomal subunit protein P2 n=1 Tax=Lygus hesperus TaxID=30085 RepID=A0A0A9YAK8_LYGHE
MSTKYLAAYALASLTHPTPSKQDVEKICKAVNIDVDEDTLSFVLESIAGRDVSTLVNEGAAKMSAVSVSAAPAATGGAASGAATGGAAVPAAADASKKKKDEPAEEEDDDMGFGLFD